MSSKCLSSVEQAAEINAAWTQPLRYAPSVGPVRFGSAAGPSILVPGSVCPSCGSVGTMSKPDHRGRQACYRCNKWTN